MIDILPSTEPPTNSVDPIQNIAPPIETAPTPATLGETPKKRNYLFWISAILALIVISVTFLLILTRKSKSVPSGSITQENSALSQTEQSATSYNQILEEIKYSSLSKKFGNTLPTEKELSLLQSKEFPFTLKYPKGYYLNYIGPSKNYPKTTIFISPDLNDKEGIDYIVRCEKDDSAFGICRENIPSYLEIIIGQETNITDQDPEASPSSQYSTSEFAYANMFVVTTINPHGNLDGTETYHYHLEYRRQIKNFSQITMDIETASNPVTHPDILKAIIAVTQSFALTGVFDGPDFSLTVCKDEPEGAPVISSLSSGSGSIGEMLEIKGCNFSGFEGDINGWIENSQGTRGFLQGEMGSTSNILKITLSSQLCQNDTSYSGLQCDAFLTLASGAYKIYVMPWGKKSNEINFTIK